MLNSISFQKAESDGDDQVRHFSSAVERQTSLFSDERCMMQSFACVEFDS